MFDDWLHLHYTLKVFNPFRQCAYNETKPHDDESEYSRLFILITWKKAQLITSQWGSQHFRRRQNGTISMAYNGKRTPNSANSDVRLFEEQVGNWVWTWNEQIHSQIQRPQQGPHYLYGLKKFRNLKPTLPKLSDSGQKNHSSRSKTQNFSTF